MFVRVSSGECAPLGIGKIIDRQDGKVRVEYFDSPTVPPVEYDVDEDLIKPVGIPEQTRVYHFDESIRAWKTGRLLDDYGDKQRVQFSNQVIKELKVEDVFLRWSQPINDPTPFLSHHINENPIFADGRRAFMRSQIEQRSASMGISALLPCAIELEAHQLEVVRRVLQDPVQRYLLADEVGLGKTIEAGVLIRQCVLDTDKDCSVLVVVPKPLVNQWRNELSNKFGLGRCLDTIVNVVSFDDDEAICEALNDVTMLVIDEAHHLSKHSVKPNGGIYKHISEAAPNIERLLLLSATPALHNERGFLEMLHLLDPAAYPLDAEEEFRKKIEARQPLAEIVSALTPDNALFLEITIDQISSLFPEDKLLQEHLEILKPLIQDIPDETDPELISAIENIHAHLTEVYRLHRRILRNRRRNVFNLTPGRAGAEIVRYHSNVRYALTTDFDEWQNDEASRLYDANNEEMWKTGANTLWDLLVQSSLYSSNNSKSLDGVWDANDEALKPSKIDKISQHLCSPSLFEDRSEALIETIGPILSDGLKCVIFCSDQDTADALTKKIRDRLNVKVQRHDPQEETASGFVEIADHPVIVCDWRAEEGLNLQGGKKVVVHYDLPLNPNRIEQRLGRVDRFGFADPVRSLVLVCDDDHIEIAWANYLNSALKVFDRSVASLQYLIEQTVSGISRSLLMGGVEELEALTERSSGEDGLIEREIKAIDHQDALDSLGRASEDFADALSDIDFTSQKIEEDTNLWLVKALILSRGEEPDFSSSSEKSLPFRYQYSTGRQHTLFPLLTFLDHFKDVLDLDHTNRGGRKITTVPYTFSRRVALDPKARANGVNLLRYGDPLLTGIMALTQADDRGRCFAMWRYSPEYVGNSEADLFFRFDFVLEGDVAPAIEVLREFEKDSRTAVAAIRRRSDMALPPFYRSLFFSSDLELVTDPKILELLDRPYNTRPDKRGAFDLTLDPQRWQRVSQFDLPVLDHWPQLCRKIRDIAEKTVRSDAGLVADLAEAQLRSHEVDRGRLGQLRARAHISENENDNELTLEERLSSALQEGIHSPYLGLDTIGAIFMTPSRSSISRISGSL